MNRISAASSSTITVASNEKAATSSTIATTTSNTTSSIRLPGSPISRPTSASSSSININSLVSDSSSSSSSSQQQQHPMNELKAAFDQLESANILQRCILTEEQALFKCKAIVLVIDATELVQNQETIEHVRIICNVLKSLAKKKAIQEGFRISDVELPSLEIFINKCDGDALNDAEARAELLRALTSLISAEVNDAGFIVRGGWSTSILQNSSSSSSFNTSTSSSFPPNYLSSASITKGGDGNNDRTNLKRTSSSSSSSSLNSLPPLSVNFHLTSIYDKSILESFSRVAQKVSPGPLLLPHIEALCNGLLASSGLEKVMLVDTHTKLFFSTDSNPLQGDLYSLCCDILDVATDVAGVYDPVCGAYAAVTESESGGIQPSQTVLDSAELARRIAPDAGRCSSSFVRLSNRTAVYVKEVAPYLATICIAVMPSESTDVSSLNTINHHHNHSDSESVPKISEPLPRSSLSLPFQALIDANINTFSKALKELLREVDTQKRAAAAAI